MSVRINWASRSSYVTNSEWDRRWNETFKRGKSKGKIKKVKEESDSSQPIEIGGVALKDIGNSSKKFDT